MPEQPRSVDWQQLEEAALNGWPALDTSVLAGWLLRAADGYTKRANSVTPLYDEVAARPLLSTVRGCEAWYARQGLPPIFRLVPTPRATELDGLLAARGYIQYDLSLVMTRVLDTAPPPSANAPLSPVSLTPSEWIAVYRALSGAASTSQATHQQLLERIRAAHLLLALHNGVHFVACGLAVAEGPLVGLFDLVTNTAHRRHGYGTHLIAHLQAWGQEQGAQTAYLQVVARNEGARRLYERLGFREAYHYWYRVPPAASS